MELSKLKPRILLHLLLLFSAFFSLSTVFAFINKSLPNLTSERPEFAMSSVLTLLLVTVTPFFLTWKIYQKRNWARIFLLVLSIMATIAALSFFEMYFIDGSLEGFDVGLISIVGKFCLLPLPLILTRKSVKEWCRSR